MTISFWLILLAALAYGLLHSLLASLTTKARTRQIMGHSSERWFRLAYNFIAIITLLPILLLPILLIDKEIYRIPFPWMILTLAMQVAAILVVIAGLRQTGISKFLGLPGVFLPEVSNPPRLVTDGFYRYVRHPLYTAGLVFIWLLPILTWNLLALNIGLTTYIFIGATIEERKLLIEFGEAYAEYRRRTPMLIPGFKLRRSSQSNQE